jgi:hypothetical protein
MTASTTERGSAWGERFGFDESVSIMRNPPVGSLAYHFTTVLCEYPKYRATFLVDHPFCFTRYTASFLLRGRCGFMLYAMYVILGQGVIPSHWNITTT